MLDAATIVLMTIATFGCVYLAVACVLVLRYGARRPAVPTVQPAVTILKPLHGDEPQLLKNLSSFCMQDYAGPIQMICGVRERSDPAVAAVRLLEQRFPAVTITLVCDSRQTGTNAKVSNLVNMAPAIAHEIVVLADSDIRVAPDYLRQIVAELERPGIGAVTSLYHGLSLPGPWSHLSSLAIDTHFTPSVIVALATGLARPCFGSTIALRRTELAAIGGFEAVADALADDYMIGAAVRANGHVVALPRMSVGHVCPEETATDLWHHEVRWMRTVRSVNPVGYAGSVLTHALPFALAAFALDPSPATAALTVSALLLRLALCLTMERAFGLQRHPYWLIPVRDLWSFAAFLRGFFGGPLTWRGRNYQLETDGTLVTNRESSSQ